MNEYAGHCVVKYYLESNSIDLLPLIDSQRAFHSLFRECQQEVAPNSPYRIRVSTLAEGSFEVHWVLVHATEALSLLPVIDPDYRQNIVDVLKFLGSYLKLRKFLGGKKPDDVNTKGSKVDITVSGDNCTTNVKVFNFNNSNAVAEDAASQAFRAINSDQEIQRLSIKDNEAVYASMNKSEFARIAAKNESMDRKNKEKIVRTSLTIVKAALMDSKKLRWQFIFNGRKISARILDDVFVASVDGGRKFGNGDALEVDLRIRSDLDDNLNVYVEKSLDVMKVYDVVERPRQTEFRIDN